jgi:glycosyltransferase involved in cell wall biosynthesis
LRSATVVLPFPVTTGGMRVLAELAQTLAHEGLAVEVFQMREAGDGAVAHLDGVRRAVRVPAPRQLTELLAARPRGLTIVGSWMDYLSALHSRSGPVVGFSGGEPTLNENEGFDERFLTFRRQAHQLPVRLLTCSRFIQDVYRDEFGRRSDYLPVALDDRAFVPARPRPSGALRQNPFRVLVMAWDGLKEKGVDFAIPALRNLQQRHLDIEIVWITPKAPVVHTDVDAELHVNPPRDKLFEVLRTCHAMVYTPLIDGLGLPPMEAMAAGVAVVATDSGGSSEFLEAGVNSIEVPTGSVPAIEEAVHRLYNDPVLRNRLIAGARLTAQRYRRENANAAVREYLASNRAAFCIDLS